MITKTQFKEIYASYQSSILTIRSFCTNEGINKAKSYYWKKRLQHILPAKNHLGFIPSLSEASFALPSLLGLIERENEKVASLLFRKDAIASQGFPVNKKRIERTDLLPVKSTQELWFLKTAEAGASAERGRRTNA